MARYPAYAIAMIAVADLAPRGLTWPKYPNITWSRSMHVRRIRFSLLALFLLVAGTFNSTIARAQYDAGQCPSLMNQITESQKANSFKQTITLARQLASYCSKDSRDYAFALSMLASGLNGDNQHEEALAVANRCLQTNDANTQLFCMYDRALALFGLARVQEAKTTLEGALRQPAITEWDATLKQTLRTFLTDVNATLNNQPLERTPTRKDQNSIAPHQTAGGETAKVTGNISCSGTAVGLSIDIEGEITADTVERVSNFFDQYHGRAAKVQAGSIKCDGRFDPGAYGTHYGINSPGGSVSAAMAIGRILRKEHAHLMIEDNDVCISACVLILAGAVDRQIGRAEKLESTDRI